GRNGDANMAPYEAAKDGTAGFMRSIAREVRRYNITANCVALATVVTAALDQYDEDTPETRNQKERAVSDETIRRRGQPENVAGMVIYLASPLASWITGQTYPVNG